MATVTYESGVYNLAIGPDLQDLQPNQLHPLLNRINKRGISQTQIRWNADLGGQTAVGEAVTADATNNSEYASVVPAALNIASSRYRHTFEVSSVELAEASSQSEGVLANLFAKAGRDAMYIIARTVAGSLYAGNGAASNAGMIGLAGQYTTVAGSLSTNAYAGIDPASYATWVNYVNENGGTARPLTEALLYRMSEEVIGGATTTVPSNYTAIYTSPRIATKYKELFSANSETNVSANALADVGYSGVAFEGKPIYMDPYCQADTMYFVDESALALYTFVEGADALGQENAMEGMNFKMVPLARTNPDQEKFAIVCKPQLQVMRRNAVAVLTDLEITA
jgi:hypothetical protein